MNSPSHHDSQPSHAQHDSAPQKQTYDIPADELDSATLFHDTLQSALARVRMAVDGSIVPDESAMGASFQRRFDNAHTTINDTIIKYHELVWSQFNDPYKSATLQYGDTVLTIYQGDDMNTGWRHNAVKMYTQTEENQRELQWSVELGGPYSVGANLVTERQPAELGDIDATADEQLEAATLALDEAITQLLP